MKKFLAVVLVLALALSLCACGSAKQEEKKGDAPKIEKRDDLAGKKIGVQSGTTGDFYVADEFGEESVERYNKGFEAVQALIQGKVDAVVIDDQPAKVFVSQTKGIKILPEDFTLEEYAGALNKEKPELTKEINDAMNELKDNGTFQKIVDYYIGGDESVGRYQIKTDVERKGDLVMATNAEFPPYEYFEGDEIVGLDADFMRAVCDVCGYNLVIDNMNFDSILVAVQGGKADIAMAGLTVTDERKQSVDFTDSYYTGRQVIIVNE